LIYVIPEIFFVIFGQKSRFSSVKTRKRGGQAGRPARAPRDPKNGHFLMIFFCFLRNKHSILPPQKPGFFRGFSGVFSGSKSRFCSGWSGPDRGKKQSPKSEKMMHFALGVYPKFTELNIDFGPEKLTNFPQISRKFGTVFRAFLEAKNQCLVPVSRGPDEG